MTAKESNNDNCDNRNHLQTSLPKAKSELLSHRKSICLIIVLFFVAIISLATMILSKLAPCIDTLWSQNFCNRWNDFWFGLSASLFAAILFFVFFTFFPRKNKRRNIEPSIRYDFNTILVHSNLTLCLATRIEIFKVVLKEQFVDKFSKLDWGKDYMYDGVKRPLLNCISIEIEYVQNNLNSILHRYWDYFNEEEKITLSHKILHHEILSLIYIRKNDETDILSYTQKEEVASNLYDFYWKILNFSLKFRSIDNVPLTAF